MIASRVATRAIQRRPFSMLSSLRTAGRAMEAHPFERMPQTQKSAPADWGKQIRRVSSQAALYVLLHLVSILRNMRLTG